MACLSSHSGQIFLWKTPEVRPPGFKITGDNPPACNPVSIPLHLSAAQGHNLAVTRLRSMPDMDVSWAGRVDSAGKKRNLTLQVMIWARRISLPPDKPLETEGGI